MRIGAGLSLTPDPAAAGAGAAREALERLGGAPASLALLFASPHHADGAAAVLEAVREEAAPGHLVGCVAEAVLGGDREVEGEPAVAVWLASLPGPTEAFHLEFVRTADGGVLAGYPLEGAGPGVYLVIADPFTFPADLLLRYVNERLPGAVVMGGMASGAAGPGDTRLFLDDRVLASGAVGARLPAVRLRPLVSQGCRPIGALYTVTAAEGNVILELGGRPPLERLREIAGRLAPSDRDALQGGVLLGIVIDEYKEEPGPGDFLVRGVLGFDPERGSMAVGEEVEVGRSVRFHVRDARAADHDLRAVLEAELARLGPDRPAGALLFTCNGRGSRLFDEPSHDAALVSRLLGGLPLAGFFCAGEIGPVGGRNFLHGFTASVALFVEG